MIRHILLRSCHPIANHRLLIPTSVAVHRIPSLRQPQLQPLHLRTYATPTRTPIDQKIEDIQELYATARDEFEIAAEETEKKTVYAADDRAAAAVELEKLKEAYERAVSEEGGEEVKGRIGGRIRELERAVEALEESAMED